MTLHCHELRVSSFGMRTLIFDLRSSQNQVCPRRKSGTPSGKIQYTRANNRVKPRRKSGVPDSDGNDDGFRVENRKMRDER